MEVQLVIISFVLYGNMRLPLYLTVFDKLGLQDFPYNMNHTIALLLSNRVLCPGVSCYLASVSPLPKVVSVISLPGCLRPQRQKAK
jgi:hypothetical protein